MVIGLPTAAEGSLSKLNVTSADAGLQLGWPEVVIVNVTDPEVVSEACIW